MRPSVLHSEEEEDKEVLVDWSTNKSPVEKPV